MINKPVLAFVSTIVLFVLFISIGKPQSHTHIIGIGLARQILTAVLDAQRVTKRPGFDLEYYDGKDPRFYFFAADWDTPKSSVAAGVGHYAVDRLTGDVWEAMGCERMTSPGAEKLKAEILKSTRPGKEECERAKQFTPCP